MGQRAIAVMNAEEFFAWQAEQDELYELVDGLPLQMMAGAKRRHDRITVNLIGEAYAKLRGHSCQPTTQDTTINVSDTQIRRPDMMIDCGPYSDNSFIAADPRAVFEVLSDSTRVFDQTKKLEEYKAVASLTHIVLIDPDSPEAIAFQREPGGAWASRTVKGLEAEISFADLGFTLSLSEIYSDLTFRPRPKLVFEE